MITKRTFSRSGVIALLLLAGLSACGQTDEMSEAVREPTQAELEAAWQEAQPIIEEELAKEDARSAVRFPCTLFDKAAASELLDTEVEAPAFAHEFMNSNNIDTGVSLSWEADACSWNNWGDGASLNLWVSKPEHFADGRVSCNGIDEDDVTEALLGGKAEWTFLESFAWAQLLVCKEDGLFFVEIHDGPSEEGKAKGLAVEVATRVAAAL